MAIICDVHAYTPFRALRILIQSVKELITSACCRELKMDVLDKDESGSDITALKIDIYVGEKAKKMGMEFACAVGVGQSKRKARGRQGEIRRTEAAY